jgi:DNA-binding transcriptional LysR family regulator
VPRRHSFVNRLLLLIFMSETGDVSLNLHQVECFVVAAQEGTLTAAAERLLLSQSAVSLAVAGLERSLGVQLFIRKRARGLALTAAGQAFLPEARDLLAHAEDVRASAESAASALTGRLTVGCFRTTAPFLLPVLLETFGREHPEVDLLFLEGTLHDIERALLDGRCEIAIMYDIDVNPALERESLYGRVPYVLVAPEHELAGKARVALEELADFEMIMLDVPPSREYFEGMFAHAGVSPSVRYATGSYELVRSLVARNLGFGLLISRPYGDTSYEGRPLEAIPLAGDVLPVDLCLAWPRGVRRTRRARAFAEHCRTVLMGKDGPRTFDVPGRRRPREGDSD